MTFYTEITDPENPTEPNGQNIAKRLDEEIEIFERQNNVKLVSVCFLGEADVPINGEGKISKYLGMHDRVQRYMLFFN